MDSLNYINLLNLVPPAIAISALAYLTKFFGKVIADQKPFSDDRGWEIEIGGVFFMVNMAIGVLGVYLATIHWPITLSGGWLHTSSLIALSILGGLLWGGNTMLGGKFFNLGSRAFDKLDEDKKATAKIIGNIGKYIPLWLPPIVLFYFGTLEYQSGSILWIILIWALIFFTFVLSALNYSLRNIKASKCDIYFLDKKIKPLLGVSILKINTDNIRLRIDDRIFILNKETVFKIEMKIPDELL